MIAPSSELSIGDISDESFDFKEITWKIPNFLSLLNSVDYYTFFKTPSFSFAGTSWELRMYPFGTNEESTDFIDLSIIRQNSEISKHYVFYSFDIKARSGKTIFNNSNEALFQVNPYDEWTTVRYLKKSALIGKKYFNLPNGVLTIICKMRTKKTAATDKCTKTESIASQFGSLSISQHPTVCSADKTLQDLKELLLNQEQCDVTIKVKGKEFKAHKSILIARSPVFASTFRHDMKEKSTNIVNITDCDPSSFSDFLCFLYCGKVDNLSTGNVFGLFTAADKYDVQDLRSECLEFIKKNLSMDTFCDTATVALQHSEKDLIELTTDFFAKYFKEIIVTVKWQTFVVENPKLSNEIMIKAMVPNKK